MTFYVLNVFYTIIKTLYLEKRSHKKESSFNLCLLPVCQFQLQLLIKRIT